MEIWKSQNRYVMVLEGWEFEDATLWNMNSTEAEIVRSGHGDGSIISSEPCRAMSRTTQVGEIQFAVGCNCL
ncbi:hypothetical protein TRIUR3_03316 [Triticum urartu]|uniref:Uncharacterized protein n=1 Tax=Triticum urartu TaxID=4572 RepID=M7ZK24_TRIUA|nr:hypothetical protein TRIUR3_03316 [Triticum urartu]